MNRDEMNSIHDLLIDRLAPDQPSKFFTGGYSFDRQMDINEIRSELEDYEVVDAMAKAVMELARAERLYPGWPADPVHAVAIMAEKSGEAVRAANRLKWGGIGGTHASDVANLRKSLIKTAAMCLRMLKHMPELPA